MDTTSTIIIKSTHGQTTAPPQAGAGLAAKLKLALPEIHFTHLPISPFITATPSLSLDQVAVVRILEAEDDLLTEIR